MTREKVHWVGEHNNTLHGNGAGSKDMEHASGDEDEVTCRLCLSLLAREDVRERISPTPVPSEVAETTAGEREVLVEELSRYRKHGVGLSPVGADTAARAVLASDWLAALLDRVRREEGAKVLREAADDVQAVFDMQCPPRASHFADDDFGRGALCAHRWWDTVLGASLRRLRARAASVGRGEGL